MEKLSDLGDLMLFYDPASNRMKATPIDLRSNWKKTLFYQNRIYTRSSYGEGSPCGYAYSSDNQILGVGVDLEIKKNMPWLKPMLNSCNIILQKCGDELLEPFFYLTETLDDFVERLPDDIGEVWNAKKDGREYLRGDLSYYCPATMSGYAYGSYLWEGISDDGDPIGDCIILLNDPDFRHHQVDNPEFLETKNIPEPILKEERNEN